MGLLRQLRLLLGKNFLLRWRHPGILLLEVVWPILIVATVALIRMGTPPVEHTTCHYQDRAMPSAGMVPFLQTFVCNLDNRCHSNESKYTTEAKAGSVSALVQRATPYLSDKGTLDMLDNVDKGMDIMESFGSLVHNNSLLNGLENGTSTMSSYFRDPAVMREVLVRDYNLSQPAVDALMAATPNITAILELSNYPDLRGVACDPGQLQQFLYFSQASNVSEVSRSLCDINETRIPEITQFLQNQLDVAQVIRLLSVFEDLKARLSRDYTVVDGLNDVADMIDLMMSLPGLAQALEQLTSMHNLPDIIRSIPEWMEGLQGARPAVDVMQSMVGSLDPLVSSLFPNNSVWQSMKDAVIMGSRVMDMAISGASGNSSSSNMTSGQMMDSIAGFVHDIQQMFQDMPPELHDVLDALSQVDWAQIISMLTNLDQMDQMTLEQGLQQLQEGLMSTPLWPQVSSGLSMATDLLHSLNTVMLHLLEMRDELQDLEAGSGTLKEAADQLLQAGPQVTMAVLKAFTHPDTLAMLLSSAKDFPTVCMEVLEDISGDVGQSVVRELNVTLCQGDLALLMDQMLGGLDIDNITASIERTISTLMQLVNGTAMSRPVSLPVLWQEMEAMMHVIERISSTPQASWAHLMDLPRVMLELVGNHSREWEPVVDMLDANYIGSSLLGLYGAAGRLMLDNSSSSAMWMEEHLGPYVHMAAVMLKTLYQQMDLMKATFSMESPMGQLVHYSTTYAPELVTAIMDMPTSGNADMVYKLVSSDDPMGVFCADHMMQHMGLTYDVAVSMENVVCLTNWTQTITSVMTMGSAMEAVINEMTAAGSSGQPTDLESDWQDVTLYSSLIMAEVSIGQPQDEESNSMVQLANMLNQGPWTLVMYANYTTLFSAMDIAVTRMVNMTSQDLHFYVTVAGLVLDKVDEEKTAMGANITSVEDYMEHQEWKRVKHYFRMADDIAIIMHEQSKSMSTNSLSTMLSMYPWEIQQMVTLGAGAYLEFIDVLRHFLLNPQQLIHRIVNGTAGLPDCGDTLVSTHWLGLAPDSHTARLEMMVCSANWTHISIEMATAGQSEAAQLAMEDIGAMIYDLPNLYLDPEVDWTQTLNRSVTALQSMVNQMYMGGYPSDFDLMPFNMTAINAKWAQFYTDMQHLENVDIQGLLAAVQELEQMLYQDPNIMMENNEVLQFLNAYNYISQRMVEFMIIQLRYINSTSEVHLFDMLGSEELRQAAQVLRYSPEINAIGVNTLIRLLNTDPDKMAAYFDMDYPSLCTNVTLFSQVVAVNESLISTQLLQKTVCDLNINTTLLLEQLMQNWDGFSELVNAFEAAMQPNATLMVSMTAIAQSQMEFQELLQSVIAHPPTFVLFDTDRWMDPELYAGPWMKVGHEFEQLYSKYQDPKELVGMLVMVVQNMVMLPELQSTLYTVDSLLDMVIAITSTIGDMPGSFEGYPNLDRLYSLLEQLPEILEMVFYTTLRHPDKISYWPEAMTTWSSFCAADPATLMTSAPGSGLEVREVFSTLCSIDVEQLMVEFNSYQGVAALTSLMAGGNVTGPVNVSSLSQKVEDLMGSLQDLNSTLGALGSDLRFLNATVWEQMYGRLATHLNQSLDALMSPEHVLNMLYNMSNVFEEFRGMQTTAEQLLVMTDVVLDQVLASLQGSSLQEMFSRYPTLSSLVTLVNELPEIYETLVYSALFTPEKMLEHLGQLMSMEGFCSLDMGQMLTMPPQAHYNMTGWQLTVCSVNVTQLLAELGQAEGGVDLYSIFTSNTSKPVNLTSISEKLERLMGQFGQGLGSGGMMSIDNYFNLTAWQGVTIRMGLWMESAAQSWTSPAFYKNLMSAAVLDSLRSAIPELDSALTYTSAILDFLQQQLQRTTGSLSMSFAEYPNLSSTLMLLEHVPEIFEMFAYTTLNHPDQLARWGPAMASWDTFCSASADQLLTAPPGSALTPSTTLTTLCSINITQMVIELNHYQGMDALIAVMSSNSTEMANVSAVAEQMAAVIDSMATLLTSPMDSGLNLRLFNDTVWEQVFQRLGQNLNTTAQQFMSPETLVNFYETMFAGFSELNETQQTLNQMWAVMDIVLDQTLRSLQGGSLTELFSQYPTVASVMGLLDYLPELYETVTYTALMTPDKVVLRAEAFSSMETFCSTDMSTVFTVPEGSTFDLSGWQTQMCSVNITTLVTELAMYQGSQDIANIFSPDSAVQVNVSSVVSKLQSVLTTLATMDPGNTAWRPLDARWLNVTLWEQANANMQHWLTDTSSLFWMRPEKMIELYGQLMQAPNISADLAFMQPVFAVMSLVTNKLLVYANRTTLRLEELFIGAPEMQKLVLLLQEPGVIEVLLSSANSQKFAPLLSADNMTTVLTMLCHPMSTLEDYLVIPSGVSINLTSVQQRLCSVDLLQLPQEVMDFFSVDDFSAIMSGSVPVDYGQLSQQFARLSVLINGWIQSPPVLVLPPAWQNESFWVGVLERYASARMNTSVIMEELETLMGSLAPLLTEEPMRQVGLVAQTVLRLLEENVGALSGQTLTLETLAQRVPILQDVLGALGVQGAVLDAMLKSPVQSAQMLLEALLTDGATAQGSVCNMTTLQAMLDLPASFDSTALYQAVCLKNSAQVVDNLVTSLDLQGLIAGLHNPLIPANWTAVLQQSEQLQKQLEMIMADPPTFNTTSTLTMLDSMFNTSDVWGMLSAMNVYQTLGMLSAFPELQPLMEVVKVQAVLVDYLGELAGRLTLDGMTIDLADLFAASPSFVQLVDAALQARPDLVTALSSIQLNPLMSSQLMLLSPEALQAVMCSPSEFHKYFVVAESADISQLQDTLCTLDFTSLTQQLSDTFMVDAYAKKFANAMNASTPLDLQQYIHTTMTLVNHITNLTMAQGVTFNGTDLAHALEVNVTQLLAAMESVSGQLQAQYPQLASGILNNLAAYMGNATEGQSVTVALKIVEVFLRNFNTMLQDISSGPITLAAIMNNTEVGNIVVPFLENPQSLEELLNLKLLPNELMTLLSRDKPEEALCGEDLFGAFAAPSNESQVLHSLQSAMCSVNTTVMMWQAIMGQAKGYQIFLQMEAISEEVAAGTASANVSAIDSDVQLLIKLVTQIVTEYQNGSRTADDLLDWRAFQDIFDRFGETLGQTLMATSSDWSAALMSALLPLIPDQVQISARTINTINIFMGIINDRLEDVIEGGVNMTTLLNNSTALVNIMEAYLDVLRLSPQGWIDGHFNASRMIEVATDPKLLMDKCASETLATYLADGSTDTEVASAMQTVMCSIMTDLPQTFTQLIDYKALEAQLSSLWDMNQVVEPQYEEFIHNIDRLNTLITQMVTNAPSVDPNLASMFDLSSMFSALENIAAQPQMIFRLLRTLGVVLDGPALSTNDLENTLYSINTYIAQPLMALVQNMDAAGVSLNEVMQDPFKLLEALPVLMDFHLQFDVLTSTYLQPTMNMFWNTEVFRNNTLCNGQLPADVVSASGVSPSVVSELCTLPTTQWIPTMLGHNYSEAQIISWVSKVENVYYTKESCYNITDSPTGAAIQVCTFLHGDTFDNKGRYWARLMTTLEGVVSHLVPGDSGSSPAQVADSLSRLAHVMKDAFLNKTLDSMMTYLEAVDRMGDHPEEWLVFKQVMSFLEAAGTMLNNGLHSAIDPSGTVQLQDLLPDSERLADLLTSLLGPASAAEMLTASVNPLMFYQLSSVGQLQTVTCDPAQFAAMFSFPPGTNVSAVQGSLCQASTQRSAAMQELIDLFQAGDVLVQLDHLMTGNYSGMAGNTGLWQTLQTTVSDMIAYLELVANGQFNSSVSDHWFNPILTALNNLNARNAHQLDAMCQSYVSMLGQTAGFQMDQGTMVFMTRTVNVVTKALPFLTKLDGFVCSMVKEDALDIVAGMDFLKENGLNSFVTALADLIANGTEGELQCSQLVESSMAVSQWVTNMTTSPLDLSMQRLGQCLQEGSLLFGDVLQGFNQLYQVLDDMSRVLGDDDLRDLLQGSGDMGQQILQFLLNVMAQGQSVAVKFNDLLASSHDVESYLTGMLQMTPEVVNSLLQATINLNATTFLNKSVEEIVTTLCDPALLGEVMQLPEFSLMSVSELSALMCTPEVNVTAGIFKDAAKSADFLAQLSHLLEKNPMQVFASNLTRDLTTLVTQLQGVSTLIDLIDRGFDFQFLMENADTIDAILASGGTLNKIVDSLTSLVGTLRYVVPEDQHYVLEGVQVFINGLLGLDLIQSYLVEAIHVSDLQKDPRAVLDYLVNELDFSPQAATALMSSTYSIRMFLNASALVTTEVPCQERLPQFIMMNSTKQMEGEVVSKFCDLNSTQLTSFMELMVPQLDIGDLLQKYITYSADEFLTQLNMTKSEAQSVFRSLQDGAQTLEKATVELLGDKGSFSALLGNMDMGQQGEFAAMTALQPVLCGVDNMEINDQFGLNSKVLGAPTAQDVAEEEQLNGEFCKDLYRSVKNTAMGSVIWAFVKPILMGKILFTPDTPLTRNIIKEAGWVFDTLEDIKRVSKKWSTKLPSLMSLQSSGTDMDDLQSAMSNSFVQGILKSTLGIDASSVTSGLQALGNSSSNSSDLQTLQQVAELLYNFTSCIELDRFYPVASEEELERQAFQLYGNNSFLGGIVFMNVEEPSGGRRKRQAGSGDDLPPHVQYKIRMDIDNVPTTNRIKDRLWIPYAKDDFANDLRYMRGFIQLQDMVEGAILKLQTKGAHEPVAVSMQQMPFPCHTEDDYLHFLGSYLLPIVMTFAWLAAIGIATHNLVSDRQSGQEEALRIMGMKSGFNVLAWMLGTMTLMALVSLVITLILKYANIFPNSNWLLLFLYFLDFCFSSTMMCYFVSAFFSKVTLAILSVVIIYFLSYMPYIVLVSGEFYMTAWQKSLACLSSTTAFSFGAIFVTRFEEETVGLQWDKMNDKIGDTVDFQWMCFMMLIDSAIYLVLGWYVRNVKPGKYGVSQPWYFPVLPSYWCSCLSGSSSVEPMPPNSNSGGLFEDDPQGLDVGISMRDLCKSFKGKKDVVKGLNVNVYHDQITTLLGHNGAAKTTTLHMLVGVLEPSRGEVLVEGQKTHGRTGMIGLCPQHNTIFEYMTVKEHMDFYGGMKGNLSGVKLQREIRKLLHDVDLWHVKDVPAHQLSGGMQRRLCVALAFVGGAKTIVLDEPTSGVDPHARKSIWNLILKNRPGRTILMSTHHLDEADMLSDRILIMHTGRLLSAGSPSFLKNLQGGGFKLTFNTNPSLHVHNELYPSLDTSAPAEMSPQHSKVMSFVSGALPNAQFVESVGCDLTVSVPAHADSSTIMADFFQRLEGQKDDLGVLSYGVSNTTLEEVFLKLTAEADNCGQDNAGFDSSGTDSEAASTAGGSDNTMVTGSHGNGRPKRTVKGASLKTQQLGALLTKRVHHYRRNWRMLISTILLPLIAFLCALGFSTIRPTQEDMANLIMTPALYTRNAPHTYAFVKDGVRNPETRRFMDTLAATIPGIGTTCMQGFDAGKGFTCETPGAWHDSDKMAQECVCQDFTYQCQDTQDKEGVTQLLTTPDIMLQDLTDHNLDFYLVDSYSNYIDQRFGGWSLEVPQDNSSRAKVWFNNKGYHAIPSYFNAFTNNILRSAVTPADAHNYGVTLYNHPLMLSPEQLSRESIEAGATDIGIAMVILLALSFIPSAFMVYLTNERVSQEKQLQTISGVGNFLYWTTSFLWDMFVYCISLGLMVVIVVIFRTEGFYDRENLGAFVLLVFLYGWAVLPLMYCTLRFFRTGSGAYLTLFCLNMLLGLIPTLCIFMLNMLSGNSSSPWSLQDIEQVQRVLKYVFLAFPQFCLGNGLVDLVANQVQYSLLRRFGEDTYVSPFHADMLAWNFLALAIEGFVFLLLTFFVHSRREPTVSMSSSMHYNASNDDEDVILEGERVEAGSSGDRLALSGLCKVYHRGFKKFCAVNNLSFGVNTGECFGLLGVNGAGKTTTFKMLTGSCSPSEGRATIHQKQISQLRSRLGDELGYCPQEDALDPYLSGRETLTFHAKLRGFGSKVMEAVVTSQLRSLRLEELADVAVGRYSGGSKRKLSLAVAMLGEPPLLLLDEPTTGMDPATRRLAWRCVTTATERGQSVLLTSHSMDECDHLCSRLAIMVNGQLKCIGSPQHLKNKYGDGYTVMLHLQGLSSSRFGVAEAFLARFPGAVIKDQHHSVVEVSIPRGAGCVADIFTAVRDAQAQHHILHYSVCQTTLDSVFINFAQEQTDDCDHEPEEDSSSGGSSSGASADAKDGTFQKSLGGGTYAYMNPEYSAGPMDTFEPTAPPHPTATPASGKVQSFTNDTYGEAFITKM